MTIFNCGRDASIIYIFNTVPGILALELQHESNPYGTLLIIYVDLLVISLHLLGYLCLEKFSIICK